MSQIEALAKTCDDPQIVVPVLIDALGDCDYGFCEYEGCVKSAAYYLLKFKDHITDPMQRGKLLSSLLEDVLEDSTSSPGLYERIELLGIFGKQAEKVLPKLKQWLAGHLENDPLVRTDYTRILKTTVEAIENKS